MQATLEGRLAADRLGLRGGAQRSLADAVRGGEQPSALAVTEVLPQQCAVGLCQLADAVDAEYLRNA
ncbi:MAG: hypothetical protein JNN21_12205 [Candidatus Accumulibacter sp.]|uniref:hypothetical protein n=1 Tax=Accumulibacter sp. TaxID=2053492 RepID=UPI001A5821E5|nr:hypothetical protein [Accumulibacter sp.]MBL8392614.1 hypothetical protein [Accumulibacter sp.]HRD89462.1 hypothetical protein [Accumulibacter sp.]